MLRGRTEERLLLQEVHLLLPAVRLEEIVPEGTGD